MKKTFFIGGTFVSMLAMFLSAAVSQETQPETQPETQMTIQETQPSSETQRAPEFISEMPDFQGIDRWFNSGPLTKASLKGKVVLVDFWTYSCVNCLRTLPYLKDWHKKYKAKGLVIVGVHSPEFEFERDPANLKAAIEKLQIPYPVAMDNRMSTWTAFKNSAWPAHYFVDGEGKIRQIHLGEGDYEKSEATIQKLLMEQTFKKAGSETRPAPTKSQPTAMPPLTLLPPNVDFAQIRSPETYLGFLRRERLVTSGRPIELNEWSYDGKWRTEGERIFLTEGSGKIAFRFSATKVNIVLTTSGSSVSAIVKLDGQPVPKEKAGKDVQGGGLLITEPRMYELIHLGPKGEEHTIEIEFLGPGVGAYAFTFG